MLALRGKCLVRPCSTINGEAKLIIAGVFDTLNFDKSLISKADEMWVVDMLITGGVKFSGRGNNSLSVEDFLAGEQQLPEEWLTKSDLADL